MDPGASTERAGERRQSLAEFIRSHREAILQDWEQAARRMSVARTLDHATLMNHLPMLLDHITLMIEDAEAGRPVRRLSKDPHIHALERLGEGYELVAVVEEFSVLRECILQRWLMEGGGATGGPTLNRAIDLAVETSVSKYIGARDRTLVALDRISSAALEHADVDAFLHSLAYVLLSTAPAIDSVSVFLREGERLRLRSSAGLGDELPRDHSVAIGEGVPGWIAKHRKSMTLRDASQSPLVHELFRRQGPRALYGIPMMHGDEVIGSAHISSLTAYEFSHEDKLLFRTMVERATLLVVQAQLVLREQAARREAERVSEEYRTLAESMPILVWTATPDGALDYGNQVLADYIGAPASATYGTGWKQFTDPDDLERLSSAWKTALATGAPLEVEYRFRRHDGVYHWFLIRALPMRDLSGRVVKWFGTCTDVDALKTAQQEATQRATFAQQLIGIVSHDLRNPVTAILLGIQSLLRLEQQDERTTRGLARVHSAAERVSRMIRDLLDFTQARLRGGIPVQRRTIDLLTIVRQSVDEVKTASPRRCINVRNTGDTTGSWDPDRIAQVITNLVTNALQYGPPNGCVDVDVTANERHVRLCVHNEGEPIPPAHLARIFEPLERAAKSDPGIRNIGLGLFIVDHIVKAHGGRVEVRSEAGEGTTFTVTLPRE